MMNIDPLHVIVHFGSEIPITIQGPALLALECDLRARCPGKWIEVFKEAKGDDSKLRSQMSAEQRAKL